MRTLLSIRNQVKNDLDLWQEDFISDSEIDRHINDSIKKAAAAIIKENADYFKAETDIALSEGTNIYDLPSDIYLNKLKKLTFIDGTHTHRVDKIKDLYNADSLDVNYEGGNPILQYDITNNSGEGRKLRIFPDDCRAGTLHVWYIRNPAVLSADTDECDIDEFDDYIVQSTKTAILLEDGDPRSADSKNLEMEYKREMISTISEMVLDDEDNKIYIEASFYNDHI